MRKGRGHKEKDDKDKRYEGKVCVVSYAGETLASSASDETGRSGCSRLVPRFSLVVVWSIRVTQRRRRDRRRTAMYASAVCF